jgi:hypothetical protein
MQHASRKCETAAVGLVQAACLGALHGVKSFDAKGTKDTKEEKDNEQ